MFARAHESTILFGRHHEKFMTPSSPCTVSNECKWTHLYRGLTLYLCFGCHVICNGPTHHSTGLHNKQRQSYGFCSCSRPEGGCTRRSPPPSAFCCRAGEDVDMTEYEVLRFDQRDSKGSPSETASASESDSFSPVNLSLTPPSSPPSTPSAPSPPSTPSPPPTPPAPERHEEVGGKGAQAASSSPQLRLAKRKAPEVHHPRPRGCSAAACL